MTTLDSPALSLGCPRRFREGQVIVGPDSDGDSGGSGGWLYQCFLGIGSVEKMVR